jgi:hypothetical protein
MLMKIKLFDSTLAESSLDTCIEPIWKSDEVAFAGRLMPDCANRRVIPRHQIPKLADEMTQLVSVSRA